MNREKQRGRAKLATLKEERARRAAQQREGRFLLWLMVGSGVAWLAGMLGLMLWGRS